jgi:hypothetical protein
MKAFCALCLAFLFPVALAAAAPPRFYVVDIRHTGDAVLHVGTSSAASKLELPYVVVDTPTMSCCFRAGVKPGARRSSIKIDEDAPPLMSEEGEETFQFPGYVTAAPTAAPNGTDRLAFGIEGMTSVTPKGKRTYEIMLPQSAKPVIVRHCLGAEGVNFRLYHAMADKRPFATYYFALDYDIKADCR